MATRPRIGYTLEVSLAALLSALYLVTLFPGVGHSGDTAKFQFVGHVLGVPHPTGHPNYLLLNFAFTKLFPFGSLAWKANLLSAVLAVLAGLATYRFARSLGATSLGSFAAAMALGCTPTFWSQAVIAEVYSLHALFFVLSAHLFCCWHRSGLDRHFYSACLVYALAFGNHLLMITLLPALVFLTQKTSRRVWLQPKRLLIVTAVILLGVAQYAYLPWRSNAASTLYDEGWIRTLGDLISYVTGGQFRGSMFTFTLAELLGQRVPMFLGMMVREFHVLLIVAVVGVIRLGRRVENGFLIIAFLGNLLFALNYDIIDIHVYLIPNYLILAVYFGLGLTGVERWCTRVPARVRVAAFMAVPVALVVLNLSAVTKSRAASRFVARETTAVLNAVGRDAVLVVPHYDYAQCFWYRLLGEGRRSDNVHVLLNYNPIMIEGYVRGVVPLFLSQERVLLEAGSGLRVYCVSEMDLPALQARGFRFRKVRPFLFELIP